MAIYSPIGEYSARTEYLVHEETDTCTLVRGLLDKFLTYLHVVLAVAYEVGIVPLVDVLDVKVLMVFVQPFVYI